MHVAVLGVGAAGEVTARLLADVSEIDALRLVDVRKARLTEVGRKIKGDAQLLRADLGRPDELRKACRGADVLVNASMPRHNVPIMREALRVGAHYIDLASEGSPKPDEPSRVHDQIALDDEFRRAGLTAVLGMGVAPGITNLLANRSTLAMDRVDAVRIRVFGSGYAEVEGHVFAPLFSPETFLDEVLWPAPVWKGNRAEKLPPFSGEEEFRFPDPLGVGICYNVNNEETETMPKFFGKPIKFIDFKYAIMPRRKALIEGLYRLGLTRADPIEVGDVKVVPFQVLLALLPDASSLGGRAQGHTCVVVEVEGRSSNRHLGGRSWTIMDHQDAYERMEVHATAFLTGAPPAATVLALLHDEISRAGVTTGGGIDPNPILRRAMELGVPLFEGGLEDTRGTPIAL
jgi:saccharopine dehydrogenase (NAD+, L-lysine-forming)